MSRRRESEAGRMASAKRCVPWRVCDATSIVREGGEDGGMGNAREEEVEMQVPVDSIILKSVTTA